MRVRKRTRLMGFDYTTPGGYFVTVVVKDRRCVFGDIREGNCTLSSFGEIVADQWHWLHGQYSHLTMNEFVVMPNHFHGSVNSSEIVRDSAVGIGRDRSLQSKQGETQRRV